MGLRTKAPITPSTRGEERGTRSLAELAAAQGITGPQDFDALFGAGTDLWDDDKDFEAFLASLRESRRTEG
jgi:hypothetical protein